jgi:hypothetical protein
MTDFYLTSAPWAKIAVVGLNPVPRNIGKISVKLRNTLKYEPIIVGVAQSLH